MFSWSKSCINNCNSYVKWNDTIGCQLYTWHDSWAVMTFTKLWPDYCIKFKIRAKRIFIKISIMIKIHLCNGSQVLVSVPPGSDLIGSALEANPINIRILSSQLQADSRFAPSQWEMTLLCNDISYWLGANLESALQTKPTSYWDWSLECSFYDKICT